MQTASRLEWADLVNARDLGGIPTRDGRAIRPGALVRSDSLSALTPTGQAALVAHGIRTVVDLRMPVEVEDWPNPFARPGAHGVAYRHVSFIDPATATPPRPRPLAEDYVEMLDRFAPAVASVVTIVAGAQVGGVHVHCAAGKDRTGLVVAMLLGVAGVTPSDIAADYALTAENLRPGEQRWLDASDGHRAEREATLERLRARPEVMLRVLADVDERHGGVESYLRAAGVAADDLDRLRERLVGPVATDGGSLSG